ncbi:MAG: SDR family NAD(P)-dependent oxidoreductase [Planctomycetota bacterium]
MSYWRAARALITGGSSGLGLELAKTLVAEGAEVALVARSRGPLEDAADMLRGLGGRVLTISADVAQPGQTAWAVQQAVESIGGLELAAACAGRSMRGPLVDTPRERFEELMAINTMAAVDLAQAAGPHLEASAEEHDGKAGHLVLIGSLATRIAAPHLGAYPATKHPLGAIAQQLRLERGPAGLHPLLVCPGPIARDDAGDRYADQAEGLPNPARRPGGGAKVRAIDPADLCRRILKACQRRQSELVLPKKARLLMAAQALCPPLGDWLLRRQVGD